MPDVTPGGVVYPLPSDEPRWQAARDLGVSVDDPSGLAFTGKVRCLQTDFTSPQTFPDDTTLSRVTDWEPQTLSLTATDQGDACGIVLEGTDDDVLRVTEAGFYTLYANYPFVATGGGGIRRTALRDPDTGEYYQTRSESCGTTAGFVGADVWALVWLEPGTRVVVEAAQNSGGPLDGGNDRTRTLWLVTKMRFM